MNFFIHYFKRTEIIFGNAATATSNNVNENIISLMTASQHTVVHISTLTISLLFVRFHCNLLGMQCLKTISEALTKCSYIESVCRYGVAASGILCRQSLNRQHLFVMFAVASMCQCSFEAVHAACVFCSHLRSHSHRFLKNCNRWRVRDRSSTASKCSLISILF